MRQRVRIGDSRLLVVGRILVALFALALAFYGTVTMLLVLGVSAESLNQASGYRTAFDSLAALDRGSLSSSTRLIAGGAGLVALVLFGLLAWEQLPRPHRARGELTIATGERGTDALSPRALERAAEIAALENVQVASASGRVDDEELVVDVAVRRAEELGDTLRDVQVRVRQTLERHELPPMPVNVTLTGIDRRRGRELQ